MDGAEGRSFLDGAAPPPPAETLPAAVMGRPTTYDEKLALLICERLADGEKLRDICADASMPHRASVYRWLNEHPEFETFYGYAMQAKDEDAVDEIVKIADNVKADLEIIEGDDGIKIAIPAKEAIKRAILQIETRKWGVMLSMARKHGMQAPVLPPPADGSKAVDCGPVVIENDPLYASFKAFEKVGKKT